MQDENILSTPCDEDFVEKLLGSHLTPTHAICPTCEKGNNPSIDNRLHPISHFQEKSTYSQARSWGYKNCIMVTHRKCKDCRKPKKKLEDLSAREIESRISRGDIQGGAVGRLLLENKTALNRRKKREAIEKRWRTIRAKEWQALQTASTKEYSRVRALKAKSNKIYTIPLIAFFSAYHEAIVNVRSMFSLERKGGQHSAEKHKVWWQYIPNSVRAELVQLWEDIPFLQKHTLKTPEILDVLPTTTKINDITKPTK